IGLPLAVWALARARGRIGWAQAAIFLAVPFVVLVPWMMRNWRTTGDPVWVSSNGGMLFYAVNHPGYDPVKFPDYGLMPASEWHVPAIDERFWSAEFDGHRTTYRISKLYMAEARRYVLHHPIDFLRVNAIKLVQRFAL